MFEKIKALFFGAKEKPESFDYSKRKKILIVEDNIIDMKLVMKILERKYNLFTACNGEMGLEEARKNMPDLIVLDCEMPVMTGNQMCKIIKEDEATKDIPVLFLTSVNTPSNIIECFELDAENHLAKPVSP